MGHPVAPLMLMLLMPLLRPTAASSPCFSMLPDTSATLNLTNTTHRCAELDWGPFQRQSQLLLSRNGIEALSPSSRVEPGLEELDLSYNRLRELPAAFLSRAWGLRYLQLQHNRLRALPDGFFANATALQSLRLEGNPLPAVPRTAFQANLRNLVVPCRCDVVDSILAPCACSRPNCTVPECRCLTSHHDSFKVTDFHAGECQSRIGLVAGLAGAAGVVAVLLVVGTVVCYRQRKAAAIAAGAGWDKRESAAAHRQPRYISRAAEVGTTDATAATPDYENIFVSPCTAPVATQGWRPRWREEQYSSQVPVDDNYFLESESSPVEQPIYANTQSAGDDIYIIPGQ